MDFDHVGIDVDAALIDQMPGRDADLVTDHALIGRERNLRLFPDFVHAWPPSALVLCNSGKSSSRNSSPRSGSVRLSSCSRRRSCTRRILPEIVFGNSVTSSILRI